MKSQSQRVYKLVTVAVKRGTMDSGNKWMTKGLMIKDPVVRGVAPAALDSTLSIESANAAKNLSTGVGPFDVAAPTSGNIRLDVEERERFLHIVQSSSRITRHYELFLLLQGAVQHFIPHEILISAWGDFRTGDLQVDVISNLVGVRTGEINGRYVDRLGKRLFARWVANGRRPMLLANTETEPITHPACDCALTRAMPRMRFVMVHGIYNERDQTDSLYLAMTEGSMLNARTEQRFLFLVDAVVHQIDVAYRKVAALKTGGGTENDAAAAGFALLSRREHEIMRWVSEGKTNVEISEILSISSYTVKNHVQRIFRKLEATNRTEAVAKYRQHGARLKNVRVNQSMPYAD